MSGARDTGETFHELRTERLRLRRWRKSDFEPFAAINADPRVTYIGEDLERFARSWDVPPGRVRDTPIAEGGFVSLTDPGVDREHEGGAGPQRHIAVPLKVPRIVVGGAAVTADEMGLRIDRLVTATGSAGTHAGLVVGLEGENAGIPVPKETIDKGLKPTLVTEAVGDEPADELAEESA